MFSPAKLRVIIAASLAVGVLVSYERGHGLGGGRHISTHSCAWRRQDSNLGASASGCQGRGLVVGWLSGVFALLRTQPLRLRRGEFPSFSCGALCRPAPGLGTAPCGAYPRHLARRPSWVGERSVSRGWRACGAPTCLLLSWYRPGAAS